MSIVQVGGKEPTELYYEHTVNIAYKWKHTILDHWLEDYNDQRKGWTTVKPDIRNNVIQVMFELEEDKKLFEDTFDFDLWNQ